ncbi:putative baseplate assembly protein [uncultured Rhodoblastus sp.]|uniref:putative baseplate assembly protein n=1 Tax=uncultured Rhodoblastus sp. TaxID=543037 RepID=UPI0025EAA889|nr:putative baseplate assembly protein [uncultured Rhodoblastus sp.]
MDCQCCAGVETLAPATISNPPGLTSIVYRVGEHGAFLESMLATLGKDADFGLRTRETDDFSIAMLDAAAVLCDILSFYQERFANEQYLRTAAERQSLVGLGQLSGYRLAPGRAAATWLAFTLETPTAPPTPLVAGLPASPYPNPGAIEGVPASVIIPSGTRTQSVPGPGQKSQIFESVEDIVARPEWNAIGLRGRATFPANAANFRELAFPGFLSNVKSGDHVLLHKGAAAPVLNQATGVDMQTPRGRTVVSFSDGVAPAAITPTPAPAPTGAPPRDFDDAFVAGALRGRQWRQSDLEASGAARRWDMDRLETAIRKSQAADQVDLTMIVLGATAALFGHNAERYRHFGNLFGHISEQGAGANSLYLDNANAAAVVGRWIVLDDPGLGTLAARIAAAREVSVSLFKLRGRVTQVTLGDLRWLGAAGSLGDFTLRNTRVMIETARVGAAPPDIVLDPAYADAGGDRLTLDGPYFGLAPGRAIVVTGDRIDLPGQAGFETAAIADVTLEDGYTALRLSHPLAHRYALESLRVLANVAPASHGESVEETLGGGDANVAFPRFEMKQTPLTFVSAAAPGGIRAEIVVRVNGVAWKLVDNLYAAGPNDRVYMLQTASNGKSYVVFGDGVNGARPPSGQENITASYRRGIGAGGNLDAGQLSLALSRPLGLKSVVNPVPATGGGDPETLEEARVSLPFPLRTLGRIVTLKDYEDFARASAGVAKASAHWLWDGRRWVALVTIAGHDGDIIPPETPAWADLLDAMRKAGDPNVPAALANYRPRPFDLDAALIVDGDRVADLVLADARQRLRDAFGFAARGFARPVFASEAIAVLQRTEGVVAVDLNGLYFADAAFDPTTPAPEALTAQGPSRSAAGLLGAQLLTIADGPLNGLRAAS